MPSPASITSGRRRLFTRRELRHKGTYVVQVGSQNVLEKRRRSSKYTYAGVAHNPPSGAESSVADDDVADAIIVPGNSPQQSVEHVESAEENAAPGAKLTHVSEGARRLLASSRTNSQKQKHRRLLTNIARTASSHTSSLLQLPPPLDLDRTILSFPESQQSQRDSANAATSRRRWSSHLTPLHAVSERLRRPMRGGNATAPSFKNIK
ncbi:hypothetical protein EV175_002945 [Coemansia sp. RSA 1933]|nr:hypothetical protein EV175_002945 [Coemansia sp. RSA 1933]